MASTSLASLRLWSLRLRAASPGGGFFDQNIRLNVHGPDVRVSNVVPHGPEGGPGGVEFVLTMDAPTDVAVTITVLDPWDLTSGWTRGN